MCRDICLGDKTPKKKKKVIALISGQLLSLAGGRANSYGEEAWGCFCAVGDVLFLYPHGSSMEISVINAWAYTFTSCMFLHVCCNSVKNKVMGQTNKQMTYYHADSRQDTCPKFLTETLYGRSNPCLQPCLCIHRAVVIKRQSEEMERCPTFLMLIQRWPVSNSVKIWEFYRPSLLQVSFDLEIWLEGRCWKTNALWESWAL